jgi:tRNA dimethylallyltransferase
VARRVRGQIINCDSRQVYREFPLVTAQPTLEEKSQCPHWLYGFLACRDTIDAGTFSRHALAVIERVQADQSMPVLVGGTGLYLQSIVSGLAEIPEIPPDVRDRVCRDYDRLGADAMHSRLRELDPVTAGKVHPRDRQRVTRALEVCLATGKPIAHWQHESRRVEPRFDVCQIVVWDELDRLTPRLEKRIDSMLAGSAMNEVAAAWEACPDESAPGWSGIGCRELLQVHLGRTTLDQAREDWLRNTRAYAKRQLTWFRKLSGMSWVRPGETETMKRTVHQWLES